MSSALRVLHLGKFFPVVGGVEKVMYDFTVGLPAASGGRVECDMMCAGPGPGRVVELGSGSRLLLCRSWLKLAGTVLCPSMPLWLRRLRGRYDIIHVHHPDPMAALALLLSGYRGRVVLHWHSDIRRQRFFLLLYRPLQAWLIRRSCAVAGTSPVYLAESPWLRGARGRSFCVPIGVEPVESQAGAVERVRSLYGGRKIVFSLGRLVPYKGFRYLVEAAALLPDDYVVVIGGSGPLEDDLRSRAGALGLDGKVVFLGRVSDDDLPAYYGACSVFCLSSVMRTEAFGIVQIEAMSCGRPVVATRIPGSGVAWVNKDGLSGLNAEPGDAASLADCIRRVCDDHGTWERFCRGARERYLELFTREATTDRCLELYQKVTGRQLIGNPGNSSAGTPGKSSGLNDRPARPALGK